MSWIKHCIFKTKSQCIVSLRWNPNGKQFSVMWKEKLSDSFMFRNLAGITQIKQLYREMCHKQRWEPVILCTYFPQRTWSWISRPDISLYLAFCSHTLCQPIFWTHHLTVQPSYRTIWYTYHSRKLRFCEAVVSKFLSKTLLSKLITLQLFI